MTASFPDQSTKTVIGAAERVDFPDWGIERLPARVDTGARSSALHVAKIVELPDERVRFAVVLDRKHRRKRVWVEAAISRRGKVRSSNGRRQERIFVRARLRLGPVEKEIEVSLARRSSMTFRMLLGRSALVPEFIIDPERRYLFRRSKRRLSEAPAKGAGNPDEAMKPNAPRLRSPAKKKRSRARKSSSKGERGDAS